MYATISIKTAVFWDVTIYSLVDRYLSFRGTPHFHVQVRGHLTNAVHHITHKKVFKVLTDKVLGCNLWETSKHDSRAINMKCFHKMSLFLICCKSLHGRTDSVSLHNCGFKHLTSTAMHHSTEWHVCALTDHVLQSLPLSQKCVCQPCNSRRFKSLYPNDKGSSEHNNSVPIHSSATGNKKHVYGQYYWTRLYIYKTVLRFIYNEHFCFYLSHCCSSICVRWNRPN
jgi:hypothetical protein